MEARQQPMQRQGMYSYRADEKVEEQHTLHVVQPVRTFGRDALFLLGIKAAESGPSEVAKLGRVSGTNRWPTYRFGLAIDRLAGTYMIPDAGGFNGSETHAP